MAEGSILYPAGTGDALQWQAQILLDGVDVSASITGTVQVDAEEGASRIASFVLKPTFGELDISLWVGKPVEINYVTTYRSNEAPFLVFKGYVDMPTYDPLDRLVTFRCSDFMQKRIERMSRNALIAEVGGYWSPYLFDPIQTNYEHFQQRMSTQCASYDLDVNGKGLTTQWKLEGSPDYTFTGSQIVDQTLKVDLASSREVTNQVYMNFSFRYPRVYEFQFNQDWQMGISDDEIIAYGIPFPSLDVVKQALDGVDWAYKGGANVGLKQFMIIDGQIVPYVNEDLVESIQATRVKRWQQPVSEYSHCVMRAPQSIEHTGLQEQERNFSYDMGETGDHFSLVWDVQRDYYWPIDAYATRYLPFRQYTAKLPDSAIDVSVTAHKYSDTGTGREKYVTGNVHFKYVDCDETYVTNILPYSNQFDQWGDVGSTSVKSNVKSGFYEDEQQADLVHLDEGSYLKQIVACEPNTPYTFSIFCWAGPYDGGKPLWISLRDNNELGLGVDPDMPPDPTPMPDQLSSSVVYLTGKPSNALCTLTTGSKATQLTVTVGHYDGEVTTEGGAEYFFLERAMLCEGGKPAIYVDTGAHAERGPSYRETFEDANICAKAIVQREIVESHRHNYVSFKTPCFPLLERFHHCRVNTDLVQASGKVYQVTHELDTFNGSALTTVRLALSKAIATAAPDDPIFLPMDKALVGNSTPPRVKSKFTDMTTYVGMCGNTYFGGYDYTIQNNVVSPYQHVPYYGWITNAGGGTSATDVNSIVYGVFDTKFVCGTPAINADHMGERLGSRYSEVDLAIPDDELVMVA